MLMAAGGGGVRILSGAKSSTTVTNVNPQVFFNDDGSCQEKLSDNSLAPSPPWADPIQAGLGSRYWWKGIQTTGNGTYAGSTLGAWLALSGAPHVGMTAAPLGQARNLNFTYQIASDAGGTNIVGSGTIALDSERS